MLSGAALLASVAGASAQSPKPTPQRGGTVIAALGADPALVNPDVSIGVPDVFTGCIVYEGLIRFGQHFEIQPALATSWEVSPDGLTYVFHLETATFSDGKPVTSEDVKFTLTQVSAKYGPKFRAPGQFIQSIETPDPLTAIIHLSAPFGPFLFSLACDQNAGIMPKHRYADGGEVLKNPTTITEPIGAGPFVLSEWVRGDHLTFTPNKTYWRKGEPYLDKIVVKIIPDSAARVLALRAGEVDFIDQYYFPLSAYKSLSTDKRFVLKDVSYPSDDVIILNTKQAPLDKPAIRQALLTAIDRNYLQKAVFFDLGSLAISPIDTRLGWPYNPAVDYNKMYPYDPKRAAALLDEAGVKPGPDGTRFTMRLIFDSGRPEYNAMGQALQRFWQAAGIKVVLEGIERPVVLKRVYSDYDFDATIQNYSTGGDPALGVARLYITESIQKGTNFNNASRYSNPEVDALFGAAQNALTEAERAKSYFKVQEILARDLPVITIHQQAEIDIASSTLQDVFLAANYLWWGRVWMKP